MVKKLFMEVVCFRSSNQDSVEISTYGKAINDLKRCVCCSTVLFPAKFCYQQKKLQRTIIVGKGIDARTMLMHSLGGSATEMKPCAKRGKSRLNKSGRRPRKLAEGWQKA